MVILVIQVRITPAKYDAEYAWLRSGEGVPAWQTEPKVKIGKESPTKNAWRIGRPSAMGLSLQIIGAAVLGLLAMNGDLITLLPLTALIGGEVIFISSLGHKGERSTGDH